MDFLGRTYHFMNTEHGHSMKIKIYKVGTEYFAISEFIHPESGNIKTFETPVTISSNMYVESPSINVKDKNIHEIAVLIAAEAIGSAPSDNIGFIITNPIA